jgi:hypothetical protein
MHGQHAKLATAQNLPTLFILTASFSKILQIRETSFTVRKNHIFLTRDSPDSRPDNPAFFISWISGQNE